MSLRLFGLAAGLALAFSITPAARAADGTIPPRGFVALFNGKELAGWNGMPHFDPRKLAAMTDVERARSRSSSGPKRPRSTGKPKGGELVNDGLGPYLTNRQGAFGDVELLIDYKTVAGADSGIYLRGPPGPDLGLDPRRAQQEERLGEGLGRPVQQRRGRPGP